MKIADRLGLNNKLILPGRVNDHMVVTRPKDMSMEVSKFEQTFQFKTPLIDEEISLIKADYL